MYVCIPYSGYNLRGTIFANHQISHLEVMFAIIKFANYSMVLLGQINLRANTYRYFDYNHRLYAVTHVMKSEVDQGEVDSFTVG